MISKEQWLWLLRVQRLFLPACFAFTLNSFSQGTDGLKLKDFRPVSIYGTPRTTIVKAKYPVIDFHSHHDGKTAADIERWVKTMDTVGIVRSILLTYATGAAFDSIVDKYKPYKNRFELWCGFDYTGFGEPGWEQRAVAELVRCYNKGARGVGELGDKGLGEFYSRPTPGWGIHIDNSRLQPLLEKCAQLHMPVSIHVAEDRWMYEPVDSTNDGLLNAAKWHVDMNKPGMLNHDQLVKTLENAVRHNPKTTFIACHLANCCADLRQLGSLFDKYPNLYADLGARYAELAPIPRFVKTFVEKYSIRIVYGTDMGASKAMYQLTFRILESRDEHFYEFERFGYHWPLNGLGLSNTALERVYNTNGKKLLLRR